MQDHFPFDLLNMLPAQLALVDDDGRIQFTNHAWNLFAQENGYRGEAFEGQNYLKVCTGTIGVEQGQAANFGQGLKDVLRGVRDKFELVYPCHAPGEKRWFKGIAYRSPPNVTVMHVDITQEYRQVEQLLEVINNAALVHDLRSPLNAIMGFAEFSQQLGADRIAQIHDNLGLIHKSGVRLLELINELLAVAENRQKTEVAEQLIMLDQLLADIVIENSPLAQKAGVSVTTDISAGLNLVGQEEALWKIFTNLVTNAIKYNQPGGTVIILASLNDTGGVEVSVKDDGLGISKDKLKQIFEPFFRADGDDTQHEGTGLGLAICKNLVERHDGDIIVDSTLKKGSSFTVRFPSWRSQAM